MLAAARGDVRGPRSARCLESMSSRDHRGRWVTKGAWSSAFHSLKLHGPTRTLKLSVSLKKKSHSGFGDPVSLPLHIVGAEAEPRQYQG